MSDYAVGTILRHNLSKSEYIYMGPVPDKNVVAIVSNDAAANAYTIEKQSLAKYYTEVPKGCKVVEFQTYLLPTGKRTFTVEAIRTNPDTGGKSAFGWVKSERSTFGAVYDDPMWYSFQELPKTHNAQNGDTW